MDSMADRRGDPAIRAVWSRAWFLYDDLREHRFRGKLRLPLEARREMARWVAFLKSDAEYQWPIKGFLSLSGCLLRILTLGLVGYFVRSKYQDIGDWSIWPFWTRQQMSQALARPAYLGGKQTVQALSYTFIEPRWR